MKSKNDKRIEMDFTNYSFFRMKDELNRDPRAPKTEPSREFAARDKIALIAAIVIFGVLALFFLTYVIVNLFI